MDDDNKTGGGSWWATMPGLLTAAAGVITAVTGLLVVLNQIGYFEKTARAGASDASVGSTPATSPDRPAPVRAGDVPAAIAPTVPDAPMDLLSPDNGGELVEAPTIEWRAAIDGTLNDHESIRVGEEAVFAFAQARSATFDNFRMLIPETGRNPKEFELQVSDARSGPYRSIGIFHPQDVRVMKTEGWQHFPFPPVTAKYLKIRLRSSFSDSVWIHIYEFGLSGKLSEAPPV